MKKKKENIAVRNFKLQKADGTLRNVARTLRRHTLSQIKKGWHNIKFNQNKIDINIVSLSRNIFFRLLVRLEGSSYRE